MKQTKRVVALLLAASMALAVGCTPRDDGDGGGSESMHSAGEVLDGVVGGEASGADPDDDRFEDNSVLDSSHAENDIDGDDGDDEADDGSVAAMSSEFTEISALSAEMKEWGSGGPTDGSGRPNGATYYQQLYGEYDAYFILPSSDKVYLTFDEGYENGHTAAILDTLAEKGVKAVFFLTLPYARSEPELVTRMVQEGHILGNHSSAHKAFPEMTLEDAAADIMELHDYVKAQYGYEMWLFRFPEGKFSEQMLALAQSLGYKSVFWSFAYVDWLVDQQPITVEALDTVTSKAHPGAIYLLHAVSQTNAEILDEVIDVLREKGYTVATWDVY